jgi:hypothetical protein
VTSIDDVLKGKKPAERVLTVRQDSSGKTIELTFRAIGRKPWGELLEAYPATDTQQQEALEEQLNRGVPPTRCERLRWDYDLFPPAAIAACCVDPADVTLEQATEWWTSDDWSADELTKVMAACIAVNETSGTAEWGKGSAATPASGTNSPQPTATASRTPSSKPGPKTTKTKRSRT